MVKSYFSHLYVHVGNLNMNEEEFRINGKIIVDWIADYWANISERPVVASVTPRFMTDLLPKEAPRQPEDFRRIMQDLESIVMKGV